LILTILERLRFLKRLPQYILRLFVLLNRVDQKHGVNPRGLYVLTIQQVWEEERVVQRDWTVACDKHFYQLDSQHERLSLVGRKVTIRTLRNGPVQLIYRNAKLKWKELPQRPARITSKPFKPAIRRQTKPSREHPWRKDGFGLG
jgi:hypothetical protein